MKRLAKVDELNGLLLVQSWSRSQGKFPIGVQNEWLEVADGQVADESLGRLVRDALGESQTGIPIGNVRALAAAATRKTLSAAGVKSLAAYERRVTRVFISEQEDEGIVEITPYRTGGKDDSTPIAGAEIRLAADIDDGVLGSGIRQALRIANQG